MNQDLPMILGAIRTLAETEESNHRGRPFTFRNIRIFFFA